MLPKLALVAMNTSLSFEPVALAIARAAAVHLFPQVELFVIYAVMAMVLAFRPYGLFTQAQPRKI